MMMKKKLFCILLSVILILSMTGCKKNLGSPEDNAAAALGEQEEEKEVDDYKFGFSAMSMENPYFIILEQCVRECVEDAGYEMITENPANDPNLQARQIQNMIEAGVDLIFISPVDWDKITPSLELLHHAGIKIVNIDSQVRESEYVDAYVGSDNYEAGVLCGKDLIEKRPNGGNIVILESDSQNSVIERVSGFERTLAESNIPFEIIDRENTSGDFNIALEKITEELKNEENDITAIMCGNDQIAVAAIAAVNISIPSNSSLEDVLIYSVDGSPDIKKELQKHNTIVAGTVAQFPIHIGKTAFDIAMAIKNDEDYEKITKEEVLMINSDNISMYGVDGWQ